MYDVGLVRRLCAEITDTNDEKKVEELLSVLRGVVSDEVEDARTRAGFLLQKYARAS